MITAPRLSPTPIAAPRLRPARPPAAVRWWAGPPPPRGGGSLTTGIVPGRPADGRAGAVADDRHRAGAVVRRRGSVPGDSDQPGATGSAVAEVASARHRVRGFRAGRRRGKGVSWAGNRRRSDLEQLGLLVLHRVVDAVRRTGAVRSSSSFSARRTSSSPASPSLTMRSSSSLARRRMLRIATLASSPLARATLTRSRRRSSVSCGKTTRRSGRRWSG